MATLVRRLGSRTPPALDQHCGSHSPPIASGVAVEGGDTVPPPFTNPIRVIRPDDLLVVDLALSNLQPTEDGSLLERIDPDAAAVLTVTFAPQHIAERAYMEFKSSMEQAGPPPVPALMSAASRLAFTLPDGQSTVPFTLASLLDWASLSPRLAANALPPGATTGPAPGVPAADVTAIELPYRLLLSPDANGRWEHRADPVAHGGDTEVWHTRLVQEAAQGAPAASVPVRAVGYRPVPDYLKTSLALRDLRDIVLLSSDFSVHPLSWHELGIPIQQWGLLMKRARLRESPFVPMPLQADTLMLSALGASARIRGHFDYPLPTQHPQDLAALGMPTPSLEQYEHVTGQGRDQFVRVVRRGFLCTGQRATIIKVTERRFEPMQVGTRLGPHGPYGVFGANAYLRQYYQIIVKEPEISFAALAAGYPHQGREMPLRSLRLTTLVTPKLDLPASEKDPGTPVDPDQIETRTRLLFWQVHRRAPRPDEELQLLADVQSEVEAALTAPFWVMAGGELVEFGWVGTDWEGRPVSGHLPMLFVPYEVVSASDPAVAVMKAYHRPDVAARRVADVAGQVVAAADPAGAAAATTSAPTDALTFRLLPLVPGPAVPETYVCPWVFTVESSRVHLEPVERVTGSGAAVEVALSSAYLDHGLDAALNPSGHYADLTTAVPVAFGGDRAGGVVRPDTVLDAVSSRAGAISSTFTAQTAIGTAALAEVFGDARLFGTVSLTDILGPIDPPGPESFVLDKLSEPELQQLLDAPDEHLKVPLLRSNPLMRDGRPWATETRYLWKPVLGVTSPTTSLIDVENAELVLQARQVTPLDGTAPTTEVRGELRSFELDFLDVVVVHMDRFAFVALPGRKPDVTAEGVTMAFKGPLEFVNSLRDLLPASGFSDPPAIAVTPDGMTAGFSIGIPTVGVGVFSLQNLSLSAMLSLPFVEKPAGLRFGLSERHHPFLVTVTLFGGGGFFALGVNAKGVDEIEAAIEFGGNVSLNLGVASGGVFVMAGVYFGRTGQVSTLTGYLRCGGYLSVLGLISVSLEFYLAFTFRLTDGGSEVWGQASLTVSVKVLGISKSVTLSVEKRFAGASGDPSLDDVLDADDWEQYCLAFAPEVTA